AAVLAKLDESQGALLAAHAGMADLSPNVSSLSTNVRVLEQVFRDWAGAQQAQMAAIRQNVEELQTAATSTLTEWRHASEHIRGNGEEIRPALEATQSHFETCNRTQKYMLALQQA